jgi:Sulfotransferase domain
MTLPTFVICGAMKSGTTSLAAYAGAHPDVFVTEPKEPHFFSWYWERGRDWYEDLFTGSGAARARGEASTTYTMAPLVTGVPERMARLVPDVKLVYLVRNPVERIRSQYVHYAAHSGELRPMIRAVREDPRYLDISRHAAQLERYLERFSREQILVLSSEQLRDHRRATLTELFTFLGVDPAAAVVGLDDEHNAGAAKRRLPAAMEYPRRVLDRARINRVVPRSLRARVYRAMKRTQITAEVSPEVETFVWKELEPDLTRFRTFVGPDFDLWGRA